MTEENESRVTLKSSSGTLEAVFYQKGGIVHSEYVGEMDGESAEIICRQCEAFRQESGTAFPHLVNAAALNDVTAEARRVFSERLLVPDSPVAAWAIIGCNFLMRSLVNLYSRISHIPLRSFDTTEEAVAWLQEVKR